MLRPTKLPLTVSLLLCFVLQSLGADNYNNNNGQTYEFGFKIDGEQHRHESKDKDGIIMGEFGFVTADDVYHVTVYATDKEGRFKILSMKNIHLKSSPASSIGGFLSTRQNNTRKGKEISPLSVSTEKPKGSCASCSKIEDLPQKPTPPPNYNNSPNQFGAPGTGPQNEQVFTPSHNPYEQQYDSPAGPSVSFNNNSPNQFGAPGTGPQNEQVFNPSHNPYEHQYTSPAGPSVSLNNNSPNQFGTPGTGPQNEQVFTPSHNPYEQQYTSPAGPSVSFNNNSPNQFGTPGTGPQNEQVFTPSHNPYEQQYTSPAGPSVSLNNNSPNQFGTPGTGPQNEQVFTHSPNPYEQQYTSPAGPSVSLNNKNTGGRTPKQFEPNGSRGPVVVPNQGRPPKPTLVNAQIQIVDKNTDIYALGPNEMKGLPPGLNSDDISTLLYTFNYTVGFHGHFEEGYTNGVKKGYYFVTGRNGVRTRIDYIADDTGFHPTITNDILDLLSEDVPKPETEKDEKYGLKGYEFKWLFYPVESKGH